ncbi:MAG: isoprenylcysteine carboxylmethyltransferase family protein [Chloroflexi bacterium]|nr:isoprenylcysteine carboxylmethyltransferase family protein [Chloroflexota bacterium]
MAWLILAVLGWGVVHSVLASLTTKDLLRRLLGEQTMRFYRLFYNLFAAATFLPILYLMRALPDRVLYAIPAPWLYLALAGQALAVMGEVAGVLQTDAWAFAGLRQIVSGAEAEAQELTVKGLYRWMRHPLYAFGLLFIWLTPVMTVNMLVVYIALTVYIVAGAYFEERRLLREFGDAYAEYRTVTPMFIPGLR